MGNVLKPMNTQFSDFYFLRNGRFSIQNSLKIETEDFCGPDSETLTNNTR